MSVYAHPKCYAARLGGCSHVISREHYISHGVLKKLNKRTITIRENGAPKEFTAKRFAFEVLCKAHNEALDPLDSLAKQVVTTLLKFDRETVRGGSNPMNGGVRVSGWDFERWVVKIYCGVNAAGHIGQPWPIPDYLLQTLFNGARLPMDLGLYIEGQVGDLVNVGKTVQLQPLRRPDTGEPCGLLVELCGLVFRCTLTPARDGGTGKVDGRDRHVPGIVLKDERSGRARELEFDWSMTR
jgi:hypothetical protein